MMPTTGKRLAPRSTRARARVPSPRSLPALGKAPPTARDPLKGVRRHICGVVKRGQLVYYSPRTMAERPSGIAINLSFLLAKKTARRRIASAHHEKPPWWLPPGNRLPPGVRSLDGPSQYCLGARSMPRQYRVRTGLSMDFFQCNQFFERCSTALERLRLTESGPRWCSGLPQLQGALYAAAASLARDLPSLVRAFPASPVAVAEAVPVP